MVASKQSTLRLKLSREVEKKVKLVGSSARLLNFHISCYWGKKKTVPPFITEWSLPGQVNKKSSTCHIITNNNHIENKFNINIFLNEKCKDAINISDFVKSIQLHLSDIQNISDIGYVILSSINLMISEYVHAAHCFLLL